MQDPDIQDRDEQNRQDLIFGKNAVLSFLENEEKRFQTAANKIRMESSEALSALSRFRRQVGAGGGKLPDSRQIERLSRVKINKIMLAEAGRPDPRIESIVGLARKHRIPVITCERRKLDQICAGQCRHQGVVALVSAAELWQLETFLQKVELDFVELELAGRTMAGYTVAIADGIEDPHNLGAIIRVAEASGVKALLIPQRRAAGLTGTVAKVSAGAVATLPVVRVTNVVQAIETLKKYGFWVVGLSGEAEQIYTKADLACPLAVVIGSEGKGIGRLVGEHCDFLLKIPMLGQTESLNAAVAAGVFFYEVVRQNAVRNK